MDASREIWLEKVYRRSHSYNSRHTDEMALCVFDREMGESAESIIEKVKADTLDVYTVFDRFVDLLDKKKL